MRINETLLNDVIDLLETIKMKSNIVLRTDSRYLYDDIEESDNYLDKVRDADFEYVCLEYFEEIIPFIKLKLLKNINIDNRLMIAAARCNHKDSNGNIVANMDDTGNMVCPICGTKFKIYSNSKIEAENILYKLLMFYTYELRPYYMRRYYADSIYSLNLFSNDFDNMCRKILELIEFIDKKLIQ